jgi:hypothetical protein
MNIKVDIDAVTFVGKLIEQFGMPTVQDEGYDELVGPYSVYDDSGYLKYSAATRTWYKVEETVRDGGALMPFDGMRAEERDDVWTLISMANHAPPKRFPADTSKATLLNPFVYQGRLLAWMFVPELKRWELAPYHEA